MFYIIYLVGVIIFFFCSANLFSLTPFPISLTSLLDYKTVLSIALICALALFCTKLFKPFAKAFLYMFGKKKLSAIECEHSLLSVKTVTLSAMFCGAFQGVFQLINSLDPLHWGTIESGFEQNFKAENLSTFAFGVQLAFYPVLYALLLYIILLPIQIALKKDILSQRQKRKAYTVKPRALIKR